MNANGASHPSVSAEKHQARKRYGVLFSHASETTIPGLVHGDFAHAVDAGTEGHRIATKGGVKYLVVQREFGDEWRTRTGTTVKDALRDGIETGFERWHP